MEIVLGYLMVGLVVVGYMQLRYPDDMQFVFEAHQVEDEDRNLVYWVLLAILVLIWPAIFLRR